MDTRCHAVYLLSSVNPTTLDRYYIGYTTDPLRRLQEHNGMDTSSSGKGATYTRLHGRPWRLVAVVTGFVEHRTALKFEWAWQHPRESKSLKTLFHDTRQGKKRSLFGRPLQASARGTTSSATTSSPPLVPRTELEIIHRCLGRVRVHHYAYAVGLLLCLLRSPLFSSLSLCVHWLDVGAVAEAAEMLLDCTNEHHAEEREVTADQQEEEEEAQTKAENDESMMRTVDDDPSYKPATALWQLRHLLQCEVRESSVEDFRAFQSSPFSVVLAHGCVPLVPCASGEDCQGAEAGNASAARRRRVASSQQQRMSICCPYPLSQLMQEVESHRTGGRLAGDKREREQDDEGTEAKESSAHKADIDTSNEERRHRAAPPAFSSSPPPPSNSVPPTRFQFFTPQSWALEYMVECSHLHTGQLPCTLCGLPLNAGHRLDTPPMFQCPRAPFCVLRVHVVCLALWVSHHLATAGTTTESRRLHLRPGGPSDGVRVGEELAAAPCCPLCGTALHWAELVRSLKRRSMVARPIRTHNTKTLLHHRLTLRRPGKQ